MTYKSCQSCGSLWDSAVVRSETCPYCDSPRVKDVPACFHPTPEAKLRATGQDHGATFHNGPEEGV